MKTILRYFIGTLFIIPGAWLLIFDLEHLWKLYSPFYTELYSFGVNLQYGKLRIGDPWSDIYLLLCGVLLVCAGCAIIKNWKKKIHLAVAAACVTAFFVFGFLS